MTPAIAENRAWPYDTDKWYTVEDESPVQTRHSLQAGRWEPCIRLDGIHKLIPSAPATLTLDKPYGLCAFCVAGLQPNMQRGVTPYRPLRQVPA